MASIGKPSPAALPFLLVLLAIAACADELTTVSDSEMGVLAPTVEARLAAQTSTPTSTVPAPTAPRPTATFVPLITPSPTATGDNLTRTDVPRIDVATARALLEAGKAVLVDVRTRATYERAHITGAISLPLEQVARRYNELPRDRLIVFYCA